MMEQMGSRDFAAPLLGVATGAILAIVVFVYGLSDKSAKENDGPPSEKTPSAKDMAEALQKIAGHLYKSAELAELHCSSSEATLNAKPIANPVASSE